jgi:o-succinylbenzoate synthase
MRIDSVELREIALELVEPFETSFGASKARRITVVKLTSDGFVGWGESTVPEEPFFNEEFAEGSWAVLRNFLVPSILGHDIEHGADVAELVGRVCRHRMSIAALETAVWELEARRAGAPLHRLLGGARKAIPCGVSIGLQKSVARLIEKVAVELEAGYKRIKIKIAPGRDVDLVRAVREHFGDIVLSVDANAAYTLEDRATLERLDEFGLLMIEQPLRPGDLIDHARLQKWLSTPICLDESIVDDVSARQALDIGACRIVNIKLGRVGGHAEARKIASRCEAAGVPVWCGGMLEAGIGRLHNAAMSTLAPFTLPGDVSDSRRYYPRDVVVPRPTVGSDGMMLLPTAPGIGAEVDEDFLDAITVRSERFLASDR